MCTFAAYYICERWRHACRKRKETFVIEKHIVLEDIDPVMFYGIGNQHLHERSQRSRQRFRLDILKRVSGRFDTQFILYTQKVILRALKCQRVLEIVHSGFLHHRGSVQRIVTPENGYLVADFVLLWKW